MSSGDFSKGFFCSRSKGLQSWDDLSEQDQKKIQGIVDQWKEDQKEKLMTPDKIKIKLKDLSDRLLNCLDLTETLEIEPLKTVLRGIGVKVFELMKEITDGKEL